MTGKHRPYRKLAPFVRYRVPEAPLTNALSRKIRNYAYAVALHLHYASDGRPYKRPRLEP